MKCPIFTTVAQMRAFRESRASAASPLVLVPTMGDLHEGHLSLVRAAASVGDVVVSIFVNPTQFAPGEDFELYPRRLESDVVELEALGIAGVFAPSVGEMYPPGESTRVEVRGLSEPLCGRHRDGHFLGVTTVCTKLFALTRCDVAVFGQKDAQQCLVLHRLVRDLCLGVDLVFAPTVREPDGLAMSSRNRYLHEGQRDEAVALSRGLQAGRALLENGERDVSRIEDEMVRTLSDAGIGVDYAEVRTVPNLEHPGEASGRVLLAAAGIVGKARLIDNLCLQVDSGRVSDAPLLDRHSPEAVAARWASSDGGRRAPDEF